MTHRILSSLSACLARLCRALLLCLPLAAGAGALRAQDVPADVVRAEVLGGWRTASGSHMAAIRLQIADGWKTYWRAPGEAGIPPSFDWGGSENVGAVAYHWPRPSVFDLNGMTTIGYKHELVLPVEITPRDPARPIRLRADMEIGVCRDICVPVSLQLGAALPERGAPDPAIRAALASAPEPAAAAGLRGLHCAVEPIRDGLRLTASMDLPGLGPAADGEELVVIESSDPTLWISEAATRREGGRLISSSDILPTGRIPVALDRSRLTITVFGRDRMVEMRGCPG